MLNFTQLTEKGKLFIILINQNAWKMENNTIIDASFILQLCILTHPHTLTLCSSGICRFFLYCLALRLLWIKVLL